MRRDDLERRFRRLVVGAQILISGVTMPADLAEFLHYHRPHGPLTADATEPAWNGYLLRWRVRVGWCLGDG